MSYTHPLFFWTGFALASVVSFIIAIHTSLDLKLIAMIGAMVICSITTALIQAPFALREQDKQG